MEKKMKQVGSALLSIAKIALQGRKGTLEPLRPAPARPLMILGNGPSLTDTLRDDAATVEACDLMAVNFAANTPEFRRLRPRFYLLADPHFFSGAATDPNVERLIRNLGEVDWPMTLIVPVGEGNLVPGNPHVGVVTVTMNGAEGPTAFERRAYDTRRAMPRPRNVLIPAIMAGIWMGYRRILIAGADHSWTRTLSVDDSNRVVSVQPHYYRDNAEEAARVARVYTDIRLHDILLSFHIAFRAYHRIAAYAAAKGVEVINITPGSFIDAFPRTINNHHPSCAQSNNSQA